MNASCNPLEGDAPNRSWKILLDDLLKARDVDERDIPESYLPDCDQPCHRRLALAFGSVCHGAAGPLVLRRRWRCLSDGTGVNSKFPSAANYEGFIMPVAMIGTGHVSATASRIWAARSPAWAGTPTGLPACTAVRSRFSSPGRCAACCRCEIRAAELHRRSRRRVHHGRRRSQTRFDCTIFNRVSIWANRSRPVSPIM